MTFTIESTLMRKSIIALAASLAAVLAQAGELEGKVTDPGGNAVVNAVIAANAATDIRNEEGEIRRFFTHSDRNGYFRLRNLPAGSYGVTGTHSVHGPVFAPDVVIEQDGIVTARNLAFTSATTTLVTGEVGSKSGPLPAGTYLLIGRVSKDTGDVFFADVIGGRFTVALSAGSYVLVARAPGWTSPQHQMILPGAMAPGKLVLHRLHAEKPATAAELLAMEERDQDLRRRLDASPGSTAILAEMAAMDKKHEFRIKAILSEHGWPDVDAVGPQASHAMWLLVQHASPELIKQTLPAMKKAAQDGELPWSTVALSIDRDLVNDGKKQRYGSQLIRDDAGKLTLHPVEDESELDQRRASVGLEPIAVYLRRFDVP
ncbi:carboxypeptidase-like regulatory domain-containing protein [Massilia sp. P8910]|uniref:carboxypeptidase-like regulatory domain-containing protein n=1 Tax=Massilia antarctica TaxID=2765360 RepID=UPI001E2A5B19|nr:carboxypeptidase-like regulatory domain-containing protein [Massilia antarctica]MCE3604517.1 carboxypeptidase-like regulatory domain-containing protein [Massilia antarctica]